MFIKSLTISAGLKIIRELKFSSGMNLIIDNTPTTDYQLTGNNVGKTTVLKLIDFCLGANPAIIYSDTERKKSEYDTVKDFLIEKEVLVKLVLIDDIEDDSSAQLIIERNFLQRDKAIRKINGKQIDSKDFEDELLRLIFPEHRNNKPTFRQAISHYIRYSDLSTNNTLKTLSQWTTDLEYETLHLFLLGCVDNDGEKRQKIHEKIKLEEAYKARLEKKQARNAYEIALAIIEADIETLNRKKDRFSLNEDFETDLAKLNDIKYQINRVGSNLNKMNIRKSIIQEAKAEMESSVTNIDLEQLNKLYSEATLNITGISKTFSNLVSYHNNMVIEKVRFITAELPDLLNKISKDEEVLKQLLEQEKELTETVYKGDSFSELENIIVELNEKYQSKGEYETVITQIKEVEVNLEDLRKEIALIDEKVFSENFESMLFAQLKKFNKYFSAISNELYGEQYALTYDKITNKNNQQFYKFNAFNANMSSGKKQGEILCFDLAYILFADAENLPCLHFLLNDKKELMHDNQLNKVCDFVKAKKIQLVVSILKDKLPERLLESAHVVVELSQEDKLFRIENAE